MNVPIDTFFYAFKPYLNFKYVLSTCFFISIGLYSCNSCEHVQCMSFYKSNQLKVNVLMQLVIKNKTCFIAHCYMNIQVFNTYMY